jgi:hypothetical protein
MKTHPGVAADMFDALAEAGINIEIISTSSIRISCVVRRVRGRARRCACSTTGSISPGGALARDASPGQHRADGRVDVPVALLGYGTVGAAVNRLLSEGADDIERATGHRLRVVRALVRDTTASARSRPGRRADHRLRRDRERSRRSPSSPR